MGFQASSWNISLWSLVILVVLVFEISREKNKQTDKQTNGGKNATPATADGVRKQVVKEF